MSGGELLSALVRSSCDLWCVWLMAIVALQAWVVLYVIEERRLVACGIHQIDDGDVETFEQYVRAVARQAGFQIEKSIPAGLHATDIVIAKDGKKAVLLLRKFKERVGERVLHATLLAGEHHGHAKVILMTNNFYTAKAEALARSKKVLLWNRRNLVNALVEMREKRPPALLPLPRTRPTRTAFQRVESGQAEAFAHALMRSCSTVLHLVIWRFPERA